MNIFTFTGNLARDCEIRSTTSGTATCEFTVAVSSGYGDKEKTSWASCVIFGKRAEGKLPGYLVKGQKVAISGELTQETWQKTEGGTGFKLKVVVNSLDLIGAREQPSAPAQQRAPQQPAQQQGYETPQYQSPAPQHKNYDNEPQF